MRNGIVLLDKASGISSAKAIAQVKHKLKVEKIGHAGTLDPLATGLLVCLIGRATRIASYAVEGSKVYSGVMKLGRQTSTDDISGELIKESDQIPDLEVVNLAVKKSFIGKLKQYPPQISALKVAGKPAYKRVRELGEKLKLQAREVIIEYFDVLEYEHGSLRFKIGCSPGTYIRSIARDLGTQLGCGGCIEKLRREASWPFLLNKAKKIEDLEESDILDWSVLFPDLVFVGFDNEALRRLSHGEQRPIAAALKSGLLPDCREGRALYGEAASNKPKGLMLCEMGSWKSVVYVG